MGDGVIRLGGCREGWYASFPGERKGEPSGRGRPSYTAVQN
jgi:hypothetical protein